MEKIFVFNRRCYDNGVPVIHRYYLGGLDRSEPDEVLAAYLYWYNSDFRFTGYPDKDLPLMLTKEFDFVESFCPIDFSQELKNNDEVR